MPISLKRKGQYEQSGSLKKPRMVSRKSWKECTCTTKKTDIDDKALSLEIQISLQIVKKALSLSPADAGSITFKPANGSDGSSTLYGNTTYLHMHIVGPHFLRSQGNRSLCVIEDHDLPEDFLSNNCKLFIKSETADNSHGDETATVVELQNDEPELKHECDLNDFISKSTVENEEKEAAHVNYDNNLKETENCDVDVELKPPMPESSHDQTKLRSVFPLAKYACCLCPARKYVAESSLHTHVRRYHKIGIMHYESYKARIKEGATIDSLNLPDYVLPKDKKTSVTENSPPDKTSVTETDRQEPCKHNKISGKSAADDIDNDAVDLKGNEEQQIVKDQQVNSLAPSTEYGKAQECDLSANKKLAKVLCSMCGIKVDRIAKGLQHLKKQHAKEANYTDAIQQMEYDFAKRRCPQGIDIECPVCHKKCLGRQSIQHLQKWHPAHPNIKRLENDLSENIARFSRQRLVERNPRWLEAMPCHMCGDMVARINLRGHIRRHTGVKPRAKKFGCRLCKLEYASTELLEEHLLRAHADGRSQTGVCEMCGKHFKSIGSLNAHRIRTHKMWLSGESRGVTCPHCGKWFAFQNALDSHSTVHSDERRYVCDICQRSYKAKDHLKKHKTTVHENKYRFHCEKCGHGVMKKQYLDSHVCGRVKRKQDESTSPAYNKKKSQSNAPTPGKRVVYFIHKGTTKQPETLKEKHDEKDVFDEAYTYLNIVQSHKECPPITQDSQNQNWQNFQENQAATRDSCVYQDSQKDALDRLSDDQGSPRNQDSQRIDSNTQKYLQNHLQDHESFENVEHLKQSNQNLGTDDRNDSNVDCYINTSSDHFDILNKDYGSTQFAESEFQKQPGESVVKEESFANGFVPGSPCDSVDFSEPYDIGYAAMYEPTEHILRLDQM